MFTGIIRHVGRVKHVRSSAAGKGLRIDLGPLAPGLKVGDSVAVSGACLTATAVEASEAEFDAVGETLAQTTLGSLRAGAKVNLERPLRPTDTLDGHLVQGHVDGLAEVRAIRRSGAQHVVEFSAPVLTGQMVPKGSVAVDGVSLTLVEVARDSFSVAMIPATLEKTTLSDLAVGSKVNIELDLIGKYVRRYLQQLSGGGGLTLEKLREAGFA